VKLGSALSSFPLRAAGD